MTDATSRRPLVAEAMEEAVQAVFSPATDDAPIALLPELRAALQGSAVRSVLEARISQIVGGHDVEHDDLLPIGMLPLLASKTFAAARDQLHERPTGDAQELEGIRGQLVAAVALGLASIDRLDRATKREAR